MKERWQIILTGRVQGIGLRYLTKVKASQGDLSGWVGNTQDGEVLIEAEGDKEDLEKFVDWLKQSPGWSKVAACQIKKINLKNDQGFIVRFDL